MTKLFDENLNNVLNHFQNLTLDLIKRRSIYKKFQHEMMRFGIINTNDFVMFCTSGYILSQLSDLRKLFDLDKDVFKFKEITDKISCDAIRLKHEKLFIFWKNQNFERLANNHLLHSNKERYHDEISISINALDGLIDDVDGYLGEIINDLTTTYSGVSPLIYSGFLREVDNDCEIFFNTLSKERKQLYEN
jgi:hypothetical protein